MTALHPLRAPVVLLIFNRPDLTAQVFEAIRAARPARLLVIADGPRTDQPRDISLCEEARAVVDRVDWRCEVSRHFADSNLGCARRVSSGLDWAFEQVDEAIILEDDCLPDPTFFRYCDELLDRFRDDQRVVAISGDNFQYGWRRTEYSYYFSILNHIWGWATWRRAWQYFDLDLALWPEIHEGGWLRDLLGDARVAAFWHDIFERVHRHEIDTWDFSWVFSGWIRSALTILPTTNLVTNIGFDARATHTHVPGATANVVSQPMLFPLNHPPFLIRDAEADRRTFERLFGPMRRRTLAEIVSSRARKALSAVLSVRRRES